MRRRRSWPSSKRCSRNRAADGRDRADRRAAVARARRRAPPLEMSPQRNKEKTLQALLRQFERLSRAAAGADDVRGRALDRPHLARTADRDGRADRELAGAAARDVPPRVPATLDRAAARDDARSDAARPARHGGDGAKTSPAIRRCRPRSSQEIAERTDGVPLFVEELTKAVLESGAQGTAQRCPPRRIRHCRCPRPCTPR